MPDMTSGLRGNPKGKTHECLWCYEKFGDSVDSAGRYWSALECPHCGESWYTEVPKSPEKRRKRSKKARKNAYRVDWVLNSGGGIL